MRIGDGFAAHAVRHAPRAGKLHGIFGVQLVLDIRDLHHFFAAVALRNHPAAFVRVGGAGVRLHGREGFLADRQRRH